MGFKLGDHGPHVRPFQEFLNRKFSSYSNIKVDEYYGNDEARVVAEAQRRYGLPITGEADDNFLARAGYKPPPVVPQLPAERPRGTLYTCQGTVPSTMWTGPQADVARAVEDLYYWQPIGGEYQAFPMNRFIDVEKKELLKEIEERPVGDPINAISYSQGSIVVSEVYEEMKRTNHPRFGDWRRSITFGNPCREVGAENGNRWAKHPLLGGKSRGIMEDRRRLTDTPDWWLDFANRGDLYCDTPDNDTGEDQTAICMLIMGNLWGGDDSIINQIFEKVQRPFLETIAMFRAIYNAGLFFGGGIKPHLNYPTRPAIDYLRS